MQNTFRIEYNCYKQNMRIVLNGSKGISQYSSLIQYMNEPFYTWCEEIFHLLYEEIEENYSIEYMGTHEEMEILQSIAIKYDYCREVIYIEPSVNESAINRFSYLVKNHGVHALPSLQVCFYLDDGLEMKEQQTAFQQRMLEHGISVQLVSQSDTEMLQPTIFLNRTQEEFFSNHRLSNTPSFLLVPGETARFVQYRDRVFIYEFSAESVDLVLEKCLDLFIIPQYINTAYRKTQHIDKASALSDVVEMKPRIHSIVVPPTLEAGEEYKLQIVMEPPNALPPELDFSYQFEGVVNCEQDRIYALREGHTQIRVAIKGEATGIAQLEVAVIKRNRIREITFDESSVVLAENDSIKLEWDYTPENGDDYASLVWSSSDASIAAVDQQGEITALSEGTCEICLSAERAKAICRVCVRPRLRNIVLPLELRSHSLNMRVGQQFRIHCECVPTNAVDSALVYTTDDYKIASITYDGLLTAIQDGTTAVYIRNRERTVCERISIIVGSGAVKKKGLMDRARKKLEKMGIFI